MFINDVEGIEDGFISWDYVNPETLFNTLKESGVLDDYKYKVFCAFLEVRNFDDFEEKVNSRGDRWEDCINLLFSFIATPAFLIFNYKNFLLCFNQSITDTDVSLNILRRIGGRFDFFAQSRHKYAQGSHVAFPCRAPYFLRNESMSKHFPDVF